MCKGSGCVWGQIPLENGFGEIGEGNDPCNSGKIELWDRSPPSLLEVGGMGLVQGNPNPSEAKSCVLSTAAAVATIHPMFRDEIT